MPIGFCGRGAAALGLIAAASSLTARVAPPVAITPAAKAAIHTVRVNPVVKLPAQMLHMGPAMAQDLVSMPKSRPAHLDSSAAGLSNAFANR